MARGARRLPSLPEICAPIRLSGLMIRFMGRERRESSPVSTEKKGFAERTPVSRRIVVPEFPQSITSGASVRPCSPLPWITSVSPLSSICMPSALNASMVLSVSWARRKFLTTPLPLAMEENMTALWDMDLSGGGVISPERRDALVISILSNTFPHCAGPGEMLFQLFRFGCLQVRVHPVEVFPEYRDHLADVLSVKEGDVRPDLGRTCGYPRHVPEALSAIRKK